MPENLRGIFLTHTVYAIPNGQTIVANLSVT